MRKLVRDGGIEYVIGIHNTPNQHNATSDIKKGPGKRFRVHNLILVAGLKRLPRRQGSLHCPLGQYVQEAKQFTHWHAKSESFPLHQ